jgi:hypothetical protein
MYEHSDFTVVGGNSYIGLRQLSQPVTGRNRRGRGRYLGEGLLSMK